MGKILSYLGPDGTFTHLAAMKYLNIVQNTKMNLVPFPTIRTALSSIKKDESHICIVPAENSIEGQVNVTLDFLAQEDNLYIQGEIVLDIEHHLLSYMEKAEDIHTIISHPQAMAQCQAFLQKALPHVEYIETSSTAAAVKELSAKKDGFAAIGSKESHLNYGVPIFLNNIGDYPLNQTRFIIVGKKPIAHATTKTSLVLSLKEDRPGGLYKILEEFAKRNINLTRIESRPTKKKLGKYLFFIDCEVGGCDPKLKQVIIAIKPATSMLKNLGSYCLLSNDHYI